MVYGILERKGDSIDTKPHAYLHQVAALLDLQGSL